MIKKLLSAVLLITSVGVMNSSAQALCTYNFSCLAAGADHGICPDSATNIQHAVLNVPYTQTMSIRTPQTTLYNSVTMTLSHLVITDVQVNLGAGFVPLSDLGITYLGAGTNVPSGGVSLPAGVTMTKFCYFDAPSEGCVNVTGTPNATGDFPIKILSKVRAVVSGFGSWASAPDNIDYHLVVTAVAGIETLDLSKFSADQNSPNPFSEKSEIRFSSVSNSDVDFKVYNLLGSVVYSNKIKSVKGLNTITVDAETFSPGVYMYSLKSGEKTITKRMVVSNK